MRWWLLAAVASATTANAEELELGIALGGRMTSLQGQTSQGASELKFGGGVHVALPLGHHFEVGVEPGVHISGSANYRLMYLNVPLIARYVRPVSGTTRIRALAGIVPGYMIDAENAVVFETDEGPVLEWHTAESVARFHLEAMLGIGVDFPFRRGRVFAELRGCRGLVSVDNDNLTIFSREVGLWGAYAW